PIDNLLPKFDDQGHWAEQSEDSIAAEQQMDGRDTREMVRRCIDRLPDIYRSVLILRDIEELNTAAVAEMLITTPNAVKIRLHRARQALKALVEVERKVP